MFHHNSARAHRAFEETNILARNIYRCLPILKILSKQTGKNIVTLFPDTV